MQTNVEKGNIYTSKTSNTSKIVLLDEQYRENMKCLVNNRTLF